MLDAEPKLATVHCDWLGVSYLRYEKFPLQDYFEVIDNPHGCNTDDVKAMLCDIVSAPMPGRNTACFQIWMTKNPMMAGKCGIVLRFHHVFGDGFSILNTVTRYIYDFDLKRKLSIGYVLIKNFLSKSYRTRK